jgi:hypothetical protein
VGNQTLFDPDQKYVIKFQTLGGMKGNQGHRIFLRLFFVQILFLAIASFPWAL